MSFLSIQNVSKQFGNYLANDSVSLNIERGKIFGLLGPNGAGKTTLIRMITRILIPDSGIILFNGEAHNDSHTEKIGYMPEERGLYKNMKVFEQLVYLGKLKGLKNTEAVSRTNEWLKLFEIENWRDKKIEELSKGMSQKVQFIATVLHNPDLLILDEPFSGLDPINSQLIEQEMIRLKNEGKSIIFSTHRMEQVDHLCDEIGLINKGKVILSGEVTALKQQFRQHIYQVNFVGEADFNDVTGIEVVEKNEQNVILKIGDLSSSDLLRKLLDAKIEITAFREILPTVQQLFIQQVNEHHA